MCVSGEERGGIKTYGDMPQLAEKEDKMEDLAAECLERGVERKGGTDGSLLKCYLKIVFLPVP